MYYFCITYKSKTNTHTLFVNLERKGGEEAEERTKRTFFFDFDSYFSFSNLHDSIHGQKRMNCDWRIQ